jgi:TPR repeat protein
MPYYKYLNDDYQKFCEALEEEAFSFYERDDEKQFAKLLEAYKHGCPNCFSSLAIAYDQGIGVRPNWPKA